MKRTAALAMVVLGLSLVWRATPPAAGQPVGGGADPSTAPCFAGAPVRTGVPGDGPSPVGRCEPTDGQRLVDNLVWVWLIAIVVVGAAMGVRAVITYPGDP